MTEAWMRYVVVANAAATFFLIGLIWFVQIVHYPLLAKVGDTHFASYHTVHCRLTSAVVIVPMALELATAAALAWRPVTPHSASWCYVGLLLVIAIWMSTNFLQVPLHNALRHSCNTAILRRLVLSNWFRTVAWSLRGLICIYLLMNGDMGVGNYGN